MVFIYIIIPVHNRVYFTRGCLDCLRQQTYKHYKVIVVDDGSTDGTEEVIRNEYPEVIILKGDGNLWWTKAINFGIRHVLERISYAKDSVILTLNDDLVFEPDYLSILINDYRSNQPCLLGSTVVDINNLNYLEYAGTSCNYVTAKSIQKSIVFNRQYNKLLEKYSILCTDDLTGRGTLIPMNAIQVIGLYDEYNFPHYMADIELSVRAKRAGYSLFVSSRGVVRSYIDATRNKKQSWNNFLAGFLSFKAPNYWRARYMFAVKYTPLKQIYFILDMTRITLSYIIKST